MKWVIYNILFLIIYPFLLPGFLLRMLKRGGYAARMGDRFALYPSALHLHLKSSPRADRPVWIHAVSVGEVQVAGQLMREWRAVDPEIRFVFSTTSSTGWKMAEKEIEKLSSSAEATEDKGVVLIYNPLDFPTFVKAALATFNPCAIVLTESEIWPNFIRRAKKMRIPLFLINARVSDRSAPRYKAARWFFGELFRSFTAIFAQSEMDADRIRATGCTENLIVTGSFKFDVAKRNPAKEAELKEWIFGSDAKEGRDARKILLGGSTWPGEDEVLLGIYKKLLSSSPSTAPLLVIAPRHFEKADAIESNITAAGFDCVRRSRGDTVHGARGTRHVYLADTTGELMGLYGISDVVFVGKSLCAHGSQNMIEPCLCGKTTFVGPYTENFRPVMSDLLAAGAITQVKDAAELETRILAAFAGEESTAAKAQAAVENRCGVVSRCVAMIRKSLVFAFAALLIVGCSKEEAAKEEVRETSACVKAAVRAIYRLETATVEKGARPKFISLDVQGLTADDLKKKLSGFAHPNNVHLWMPGAQSWVLVEHVSTNGVSLAGAMDALAEDTTNVVSLPEVFAGYVGTLEDVLPAFDARLEGEVVPEWFVTKKIPELDWLRGAYSIDEDILKLTLEEIRSMQVVRRLVLEGNMAAAQATDKKGEELATEKWARAYLRNPNDSLLNERCENLRRNATGFLAVNKILQAMKCYETLILINPKDIASLYGFGKCLRNVGREDLAKEVYKRADELVKAKGLVK